MERSVQSDVDYLKVGCTRKMRTVMWGRDSAQYVGVDVALLVRAYLGAHQDTQDEHEVQCGEDLDYRFHTR